MHTPVRQIPEGTPLLSQDGAQVIARFKFLQGTMGDRPDSIYWHKLPIPSERVPTAYEAKQAVGPELSALSARCVFRTPGFQVWRADFSIAGTEPEEYPAYFPPSMFQRRDDLNGELKMAAAIETALEDREVERTLEVLDRASGGQFGMSRLRLRDYARYLRDRGESKLGA